MSGRAALLAIALAVAYLIAITHGIPGVIDGR